MMNLAYPIRHGDGIPMMKMGWRYRAVIIIIIIIPAECLAHGQYFPPAVLVTEVGQRMLHFRQPADFCFSTNIPLT